MKEIRKSFKILWYPFTKSKKKSYRINIFRKDGTFEKKYVNNGKVYAKGKYQLYNIDDLNMIIFTGKKQIHGKWEDYAASGVTKFTKKFHKYHIVSVPYTHTSGVVRKIDDSEYKRLLKLSNKSRVKRHKSRINHHKSRAKHRKSRKSRRKHYSKRLTSRHPHRPKRSKHSKRSKRSKCSKCSK